MTPERWNKIKVLFSSAQDVPDDERDGFLDRACGDDAELRGEIEKLLDSYSENDDFLEDSAVADAGSLFGPDNAADGFTSSDASPPQFEVGTLLNERYEIVRLLGRGGMGEVYLASDTRIKRKVALKVLHSDLVSSKESLRRFALEAQAVSALNHPHIMTIYEFGDIDDGTLFFAAEYVDGSTLNNLIGADLSLVRVLDIAIQISTALSAAHEAGITHRDIKPENIMVRPDGYIKVLDFGLAKLTQQEALSPGKGSEDPTKALHRTKPGAVMGTAAYMSPEQARGVNIDDRTDIWSLGVVIYEMLAGRRPFTGETSADIIVSVLSTEPVPVASYLPDLPAELEWIVEKALAKNVDGRYQTAKELRADLDKIKKRIEFDLELTRSSRGGPHAVVGERQGEIPPTVEQRLPTSPEVARETGGGQSDSNELRPAAALASRGEGLPSASSLLPRVVTAFLLVVALSAAGYFVLFKGGGTNQIDSIAVLPFENLSANPDLNYVSDGLSENLIDRLSQIPQLKVISRSSSFRFRGSNLNLRDISAQLNVKAVLTGSVSKVGDDLVIRIDIVDAIEDRQITGAQYRRKATDLVHVQNEIAQSAVEQLRLKLTDSQSRRITSNGTENSDAFRFYLSGLVALNDPKFARGRALEYFERAVELDPDYAPAHAEIGWIYWAQANATDDPDKIVPKARSAVERALKLDPDLAKAHVVNAMMRESEFDWGGAEREYKRAIELSPNLDFARNNYGFFLSVLGRHDEALRELEEQRVRDPINRRLTLLHQAIVLIQARRFDDGLRAYQEAQAVEPSRTVPYFALGYAYAGKGLINDAIGNYEKSIAELGGPDKYSQPLVYLAVTYAKIPEKRNDARALLAKIETMSGYSSPALLAAVHSALDEDDRAMELLEQAYVRRDPLLRYIGTGYEYDGLRSDPRFVDLINRIGLKN